jgi:trehalose/maltose transport system substrate-binding protein
MRSIATDSTRHDRNTVSQERIAKVDELPTMSPLPRETLRPSMTRRDLLHRAAALGLMLPPIAGIVASCGGDRSTGAVGTPTPTLPPLTPTPAILTPTSARRFDPDRPPAVPDAARLQSALAGQQVALIGSMDDAFLALLAARFQEDTGIPTTMLESQLNYPGTYSDIQGLVDTRSPDADMFVMDITWPGSLADHLLDLRPALGATSDAHDPALIANMTVDGVLYALPTHHDLGMLYYRTDLLERYGYASPPATWDELDAMAAAIQEGERATSPNFVGFVFQGENTEGLTCNALEWIASAGGGSIADASGVTLDNPAAIAMLDRAGHWLGSIAPSGVVTYEENASRRHFQGGRAAFMRNWSWVWWTASQPGEPIAGKFSVAPLPSEPGITPVATSGGQALGVSIYSQNQEAAVELLRYFTSPDVQAWKAVIGQFQPTISALYENPDVQAALPFRALLRDATIVPRPSSYTNSAYQAVSAAFSAGVAEILLGGAAAEVVPQMATQIRSLIE